jgi:hypothetical protein
MDTKRQDIGRAYCVAGAGGTTVRAPVDPAVSAPPPAYGTRLRAIGFVNHNRACGFVVELIDELAGTGLADGLRLYLAGTLGGLIERLAHIAQRTGEGLSHLARGFVAEVTDASLAPLAPIEQPILATLQALVAARAFLLARLQVLDSGKLLIAVFCGIGSWPWRRVH